jgi:hypothetical protein
LAPDLDFVSVKSVAALGLGALLMLVSSQAQPASATKIGGGRIVVRKAGFSGETSVTYGVVLSNPSALDAYGVLVTVKVVNEYGLPVGARRSTVTVIPAGARFVLGGQVGLSEPADSGTRIRVSAHATSWKHARVALAAVTNRRVAKDPGSGKWLVSGVFTNPYRTPLQQYDARACAVVFAKGGRALGGTCDEIGAATGGWRVGSRKQARARLLTPLGGSVPSGTTAAISIDPGTAVRRTG